MKLSYGLHLAYCTNIHRGETWLEIFQALQQHTLVVRERVSPDKPYAIGLRLGIKAAQDLGDPRTLLDFLHWLDQHNCYVFTINGFPYGQFHGTRVKEQVYAPDWTTPERLEYTVMLFDLLAQMVPPGSEGSVSTVPVSFKEFIRDEAQAAAARANLWQCVDQIHKICRRYGRNLHLGLEPEPLCYLENTRETVKFFDQMHAERPGDTRLYELLGVNYDCCHLAIQFEDPREAIKNLRDHGIRISKIHLSNALKVKPTPAVREALRAFQDPAYFHQVISRDDWFNVKRFTDLDLALADIEHHDSAKPLPEWRIHFHIPLHSQPTELFGNTSDHLQGVLDAVAAAPGLCSHFEMETYTWEVMPEPMKHRNVVDQLVAEYQWTLGEFAQRGISSA
jgi:hypothetical protein